MRFRNSVMYIHAVPYHSYVYTCGSLSQFYMYMRLPISVVYIHTVPYLSYVYTCTCGIVSFSVMNIHVHAVLLVSQLCIHMYMRYC